VIRLLLIVTLALPTAALAAAQQPAKSHNVAPPTKCRDAKTGQFVSLAYAKKYPGLTVCEAKK
jgi:hypothetical protein